MQGAGRVAGSGALATGAALDDGPAKRRLGIWVPGDAAVARARGAVRRGGRRRMTVLAL